MIGCCIGWGLSLSIILIVFLLFCTGILNIANKKKVLDILLNFKDSISGLWAIVGDFNEILHPHEKIGGIMETLIEYRILLNLLIVVTFSRLNHLAYLLLGLIKEAIPPYLRSWI